MFNVNVSTRGRLVCSLLMCSTRGRVVCSLFMCSTEGRVVCHCLCVLQEVG